MKRPLQIPILFHAGSERARALAERLFEDLAGGPEGAGLRIHVPFVAAGDGPPPAVRLDDADHTLVVALVDERMVRRVPSPEQAERWADLLAGLLAEARSGQGPHAVLPVALEPEALDLDPDRLGDVSFVRLERVDAGEQAERLLFHVASAALQLLDDRAPTAASSARAPVRLFLSHAKADLPTEPAAPDDDAVRALILELGQGPVEAWFDAKSIPRGGRFPEEIARGVIGSSALVAVVTNTWSCREWCRRELLEAKEARRPILVVDHITDQTPRLFPYLGNAPVIRWRDRRSASGVVTYAVREALRHRHQRALLAASAGPDDVVLGSKPELLALANVPAGARRVLYADPPVGEEELRELLRWRPDLEITTPLSFLAERAGQRRHGRIALSLSDAQDSGAYGGSARHLALLSDDLNLYLLLAGFSIAYGGTLGPTGRAPGEVNYTERLFGLARAHSPLAKQLSGRGLQGAIRNYVGWPIHLGYGDAELRQYGAIAELAMIARPEPLGVSDEQLGVGREEAFEPDSAERRFAWARGMTAMREAMRDAPDIVARVVLGGKLSGYVGRYPGVLEEVLLDVRARRPVFLLGALGGAARLAYDALCGRDRAELTTAWVIGAAEDGRPRYPHHAEVLRLHHAAGLEMKRPEELAQELTAAGRGGLALALNNGLSDADNDELAQSSDPRRIVELVLSGLAATGGTGRAGGGGGGAAG